MLVFALENDRSHKKVSIWFKLKASGNIWTCGKVCDGNSMNLYYSYVTELIDGACCVEIVS